MRQICALESTLLGNVSVTNGEVNGSSTVATPTPTASTNGARPLGNVSSSPAVVIGGIICMLLAGSVGMI